KHRIALSEVGHALPDEIDRSGDLRAGHEGRLRRVGQQAQTRRRVADVHADGLDADPDLAAAGQRVRRFPFLQHLGRAVTGHPDLPHSLSPHYAPSPAAPPIVWQMGRRQQTAPDQNAERPSSCIMEEKDRSCRSLMPRIENLPAGSSAQRNNLNHQAIEDYLKTCYTLAEEESPVSTSRIAAMRGVKPASATSMIQRLAALELVNYEKHYGATPTETGRHIALEVIRHHRLIELYLMEALGFTWDEVHEQADILEHVISEKLEERIAAALDYPTVDPHGDPIPARDRPPPQRSPVPL